MGDGSLDQLLKSLIQHVSDMRQDVKNLDGVIRKIPHETAPDLRPDLKKLYELCSQLAEGGEFKEVIAEQTKHTLSSLTANLMRAQNNLTSTISDQMLSVSQGLQRLAFAFNKRSAAIGACLTAGALIFFLIAGYSLRYYQGKALIDQAKSDLEFSSLRLRVAETVQAEGQEMIDGNKTLKEFVKNGNSPGWLKCKGQGTIRHDADGRRICTIDVWLDPQKK